MSFSRRIRKASIGLFLTLLPQAVLGAMSRTVRDWRTSGVRHAMLSGLLRRARRPTRRRHSRPSPRNRAMMPTQSPFSCLIHIPRCRTCRCRVPRRLISPPISNRWHRRLWVGRLIHVNDLCRFACDPSRHRPVWVNKRKELRCERVGGHRERPVRAGHPARRHRWKRGALAGVSMPSDGARMAKRAHKSGGTGRSRHWRPWPVFNDDDRIPASSSKS